MCQPGPCSHPYVSAIVSTCGSVSLTRCIESLLHQNCDRCEIIVVLNGKSDPEFAESLSCHPVRVLSELTPGVSAARNCALHHAKGEVLAFTDDDVVVATDWLHRLLDGFTSIKTACVTGRLLPEGVPYLPAERYTSERALSRWELSRDDKDWFHRALHSDTGFGCNIAFTRGFLEECGGFPEDLGAGTAIGGGDEHYMFFQVLKRGYCLSHVPDAVVTHFFDDHPAKHKSRVKALCASAVAFHLKLMMEEGPHKLQLVRKIGSSFAGNLRTMSSSSQPSNSLSEMERLDGYLQGIGLFWASLGKRKLQRQ